MATVIAASCCESLVSALTDVVESSMLLDDDTVECDGDAALPVVLLDGSTGGVGNGVGGGIGVGAGVGGGVGNGVGGAVVGAGVGIGVSTVDVMPGVQMFSPTSHSPSALHLSSVQPFVSAVHFLPTNFCEEHANGTSSRASTSRLRRARAKHVNDSHCVLNDSHVGSDMRHGPPGQLYICCKKI